MTAQVVGSVTVSGNSNAFYWSPTSGGEVKLEIETLLATTPVSSQAWGINDAGQICGCLTDTEESYAFVYSAGTGPTDLGSFGPQSSGTVRQRHQCRGASCCHLSAYRRHSFYQDTAIVSSSGTVLATLPQGQGYGYGIDANGDAVGFNLETAWYILLAATPSRTCPCPPAAPRIRLFVSDNGLLVAGQNFNSKHALLWFNGEFLVSAHRFGNRWRQQLERLRRQRRRNGGRTSARRPPAMTLLSMRAAR